MERKILLSKRTWLNPKDHSDSGAVASSVSFDGWSIGGNVSIWDCSRKIELDFNIYSLQDAKDRATKIDLLIEHLQQTRTALGKACDLMADKGSSRGLFSASDYIGEEYDE